MSSDPSGIDLRLLEAQLRNLTINVTVVTGGETVRTSASASSSRQPGSEPSQAPTFPSNAPSSTAGAGDRAFGSPTWAHRTTSADCPPSVLRLARSLRSTSGGSGEERVRRAYLKGREAATIVRGEAECYTSDTSTTRRICYVVLLAEGVNEPFVTFNRSVCFNYVKTGPGGTWNPDSVSHGFASQAEAEAYCFGAGLLGLPRRRDQ